jgi:hypothetical protein
LATNYQYIFNNKNYKRIFLYISTVELMKQIIKAQPVEEEESQVQLLDRLVKQEWERMGKDKESER